MKERYIRVNWNCDLSKYSSQLLALHEPNSVWQYNPISVEKLCQIVPELYKLNQEMIQRGWSMIKPKIMNSIPGSWGRIHVDKDNTGKELIDLGFNIPIKNGTSMITRWYDLSELPISENLHWKHENLSSDTYHFKWLHDNAKMLVNERCIDTMLLDGCYLFRSDDPHNVDGRHSSISRSMLSIRWTNLETDKLMQWKDKEVLIDVCGGRFINSN